MSAPTAVVAGALANKVGNGGEAWVRPTWTLGLDRLGWSTWLVERLAPGADRPAAIVWFEQVCGWFGLTRRVLLDADGTVLVGPEPQLVRDVLAEAAVAFDLSGHLGADRSLLPRATLVHVDLDPGFTQFWAHAGAIELAGYDLFVSVGTTLSDPPLPLGGIEWIPTLPPVLVDRWQVHDLPAHDVSFSTVGSWRPPHGTVVHDGVTYGIKAHQFRRFHALSGSVDATLRPALSFHEADLADRDRLVEAGFDVRDPRDVAATPWDFADWVQSSWGEWSVAQGLYVECRTGWVSDRSAHYLAAGRPVIVQDTGAAGFDGDGTWSFTGLDDAAAAIDAVLADPIGQRDAARSFAESRLDAEVVLGRLVERIGVPV